MLGIHFWGHCRLWFPRSLFLFFLAIFPLVVSAEGLPGFPANPDLKQIQAGIDKIMSTIERCRDMKCPSMNCASANELMQNMINTEMVLDDLLKWLLTKASEQRQHYACTVGDRDLTDARLRDALRTLNLQASLHEFGDSLLKITAILDFWNDRNNVVNTENLLRDKQKFAKFLLDVDKTINVFNSMDSLQKK
jgi:hypothetical protein